MKSNSRVVSPPTTTLRKLRSRLIEETKFPVQEMVSHVFPLKDIEKCIRAVGGEIPEMFPTKALINPTIG